MVVQYFSLGGVFFCIVGYYFFYLLVGYGYFEKDILNGVVDVFDFEEFIYIWMFDIQVGSESFVVYIVLIYSIDYGIKYFQEGNWLGRFIVIVDICVLFVQVFKVG